MATLKFLEFFREGIKDIKTVGTITRSSSYLCKAMVKHVDFQKADLIVELGAGDGVITKHILQQMKPDAKLLAFEVNSAFCEVMRKIDDDRLVVVEDSAENLDNYLAELGKTEVNYVISAIPFVVVPKEVTQRIVGLCHDRLEKGGLYIQVHYSLIMKKLYKSIFNNIKVNFVPFNIPPAFVLVSEKK